MITLKTLLTEAKYEYGCVMAKVPEAYAASIVNFGKQVIPDDMLYIDPKDPSYGRDDEPHVTIKFGLIQSYSPEQMSKFLEGAKPFNIRISGMSIFSNPMFDVVKLTVDGDPELYRLRQIFDQQPNADKYKEYHPHMTLAYVKPGLGARFANRAGRGFSKIPITEIKYSDRGKKSSYRLQ